MLLKAHEVAEMLGVSVGSVWRWSASGRLPAPVKLGRASRWRKSEIEAKIAKLSPVPTRQLRLARLEQAEADAGIEPDQRNKPEEKPEEIEKPEPEPEAEAAPEAPEPVDPLSLTGADSADDNDAERVADWLKSEDDGPMQVAAD